MKCDEIEILISAYIDGEVTEEEKRIVEEHLCDCGACRKTLDEFSGLHTLSQELEVQEAPPGFRQRVTQRISEKPWIAFWWRRLPRLAYASFALLLVFSAAIITLHVYQTWNQASPDIDVYAEDILFNQLVAGEDSLFSGEYEVSVAEEILGTIDFSETDTSFLDKNSLSNELSVRV